MTVKKTSVFLVIAALVLLLAMTAAAKDKYDKDEISIFSLAGGPIQTTTPGDPDDPNTGLTPDPIPLAPLAETTFTQKAGEALLVIADADLTPDENTNYCGVWVVVRDSAAIDPDFGLLIQASTNKGPIEGGGSTQAEILPAPAADVEHTLVAYAGENGPNCDAPDPDGVVRNDTWTVSLDLSIVTLRN